MTGLGADVFTEKLQRGLFEEEANHNLDSAIKEYQSVVAQADEQRKVIATALFRLGECYRKLGRTNEANAQYQRILGDFSEQDQLVKLSRDLLGTSISVSASPSSGGTTTQAEAEDLARVKTLIKNSPDLLQNPGTDGLSELQRACREGHYSVVEFIVSQGVSANGPERGTPPLVYAAERGHLGIARLLLEKGADENAVAPQNRTALMKACESGFRSVAELLLQRRADVNRVSSEGATALHFAVSKGYASVAELLLQRGAKPDVLSKNNVNLPNWPDLSGATPLHFAAFRSYSTIAEMLLKAGANADATNHSQLTPLHFAARAADSNICALLLEKGADPNRETQGGNFDWGNTPFSLAIATGRPDLVALFIGKGGSINRPIRLRSNNSSYYPVHLAVHQNQGVLDAVLAAKPDLEVFNQDGLTPLLDAVKKGVTSMVESLLVAGADPNRARPGASRPLWFAVYNHSAPQIVAALLKHGADPNFVGGSGQTPLSYVESALKDAPPVAENAPFIAAWREIEKLLHDHGANPYLQRLSTIGYTRPNWTPPGVDRAIFFRGTNDYNRYTLFEFLAAVFNQNVNTPPFPDFAHVTLERLEGVNPKPREMALNLEEILGADDCAKDIWLEWGDRVSIPELDHPLNERWAGLPQKTSELLRRCLIRLVQVVVKQETNTVELVWTPQQFGSAPGFSPNTPGRPIARPSATPVVAPETITEKRGKTLQTSFRLKDVVYGANVLRASSDPTQVTVTRPARANEKARTWTIDLTKVSTSNEHAGERLPSIYDLWLRDGDVIEIPEKQ